MQDNKELLNVDDGIWWIDDGILEACRIEDDLDSLKLPNGIIEIGYYAFRINGIRSIYVPVSTHTIRDGAFDGCCKLEELYIANPDVYLESGCFYNLQSLKAVYIGGKKINVIVTEGEYGIGDNKGNCLERYLGEDERYTVDSDIKKINQTAFYNNSTLKEVVIPPSVVEIDDEAFAYCKALEQVELPDTLEIIDRQVFAGCTNIREIKIPKSCYSILDAAFVGWKSNQTIYVPLSFKKLKLLQKWRRGCKATIIYY